MHSLLSLILGFNDFLGKKLKTLVQANFLKVLQATPAVRSHRLKSINIDLSILISHDVFLKKRQLQITYVRNFFLLS